MRSLVYTFTVLLLFFAIGCGTETTEKKTPIKPTNPEKLTAKGEARSLEVALEKALTSQDKLVPATECPEAVIENLPSYGESIVECGALRVPGDHENPDESKPMSLGYLKWPKKFDPEKPLIVIEQGGPGSSSMILAAYYLHYSSALAQEFNILAIEQRGTEWTKPNFRCNETSGPFFQWAKGELSDTEHGEKMLALVRQCFDRFSERTSFDIKNLNTFQIAKDLVLGTSEFGKESFHFLGVSYGTLVGQYLLEFEPNHLERVVLDSPVVPFKSFFEDMFKNLDDVAARNFDLFRKARLSSMTRDEALGVLRDAIANFKDSSLKLQLTFSEKTIDAEIDQDAYSSLVKSLLLDYYNPTALGNTLWAARHLEGPDSEQAKDILRSYFEGLVDPYQASDVILYQSIICREFPVAASYDQNDYVDNRTFLKRAFPKSALVKELPVKYCELDLPEPNPAHVVKGPIETDAQVLVVGAENDHVTSPKYVEEVASKMTNAITHVFKDTSHGVFSEKECVSDSIVDYLLSEDASFKNQCRDLDVSD